MLVETPIPPMPAVTLTVLLFYIIYASIAGRRECESSSTRQCWEEGGRGALGISRALAPVALQPVAEGIYKTQPQHDSAEGGSGGAANTTQRMRFSTMSDACIATPDVHLTEGAERPPGVFL